MKTIFITSFHVLVSRNILLSPFFGKILESGFRIVILVPKKKETYFKKTFGQPGVVIVGLENKLNRLDDFFKDLALAAVKTSSLRTMRRRKMGIERPIFQRLFFFAPLVRPLIPVLYRLLMSNNSFAKLFETYKPDLFMSTDVFSANDCRLMRESKSRGVKTAGLVRSWDNLTAKGGFRVVPDKLIVQNRLLADEAFCIHKVPAEIIEIVGIPHYDNYAMSPQISRSEFLAQIGIPKDAKFFVYAPLGDRIIKVGDGVQIHNYDAKMIKIIEQNLPDKVWLVVRFPPTDTVSLGDVTFSSQIIISRPGLRFGEGVKGIRSSEMSREDDRTLFETIYFSNGVINPFSSLCVDAAFIGRPIIVPTFDPEVVPYWDSVARLQEFDHFQVIVKHPAVRKVADASELKKAIVDYANSPELNTAERADLTELECFSRDGRSSARLLSAVLK